MTEQNGHEEHERNSARDGDAGFAALEATEPHFGSSALGNSVSFLFYPTTCVRLRYGSHIH